MEFDVKHQKSWLFEVWKRNEKYSKENSSKTLVLKLLVKNLSEYINSSSKIY